MHICFLFFSLGLGGTQTLMVRMSKWLVSQGHDVTVLSPWDGAPIDAFPDGVKVVVDRYRYISVLTGGSEAASDLLKNAFGGKKVDVFYALDDPSALWVAAALVNAQASPSKCLAGVYRPGSFTFGQRLRNSPKLASLGYPGEYLFQHHLPSSCRIYMNEAVKESVEVTALDPVPGVIWPLPIDGNAFQNIERNPEPGLIVSVGQLVPMKEYNFWMIDIVGELVVEGLDVRWHVYGEGEFREQMIRRIEALGLTQRILLKGGIAYRNLGDAFVRAQVFVGMGTSLVEAALAGVPAVVAPAFGKVGRTYGFLQDLPGFTVGETVNQPLHSVKDLIRQVMNASPSETAKLVADGRVHAERFSLNVLMPEFLKIVDAAPFFDAMWRPRFNSVSSAVYSSMVRFYKKCREVRAKQHASDHIKGVRI